MAQGGIGQPLICAAIDFGTTYTRLAFADWSNKKVILTSWDIDGPQGIEMKAPTAVLFNPNRKFLAFGFDAVKKYSRITDKQKYDCYYFENFKMDLHQEERFTDSITMNSTNNPEERSMLAIKVIAAAMRCLKEKLMSLLNDAQYNAKDEDVRWVITVPGIWQAPARQLMRRAAYEAELCKESSPHDLILSLEPESAAFFVLDYLELKDKGIADDKLDQSLSLLSITDARYIKYEKYMILDCGGGTVDVCVHQVLHGEDGFTVRECYRATGGAWGGIYVDEEFINLMKSIFSTDFIEYAQQNLLTAWSEIMREFEFWKRQVQVKYDYNDSSDDDDDDDDDDEEHGLIDDNTALINIPCNFIMKCQQYHQVASIKAVFRKSKVKGCKFDTINGKLLIKGKVIRKLLMSQIGKIVSHVKDLQGKKECYKLDGICLVGGFSDCKMLQIMIQKLIATKNCKIIIPVCPSLAIVRGSIAFGFNPKIITQRISACTYGLGKSRPFQTGDKPEYKYTNSEGKVYCTNIFMEIFRELTPITKENWKYKTKFIPINRHQQSIGVSLYKSKYVDVKYTTENGVQGLGHMSVPLSGEGFNREVEVTVDFSGTEIFASVQNLKTKETKFISVDFLSKQC